MSLVWGATAVTPSLGARRRAVVSGRSRETMANMCTICVRGLPAHFSQHELRLLTALLPGYDTCHVSTISMGFVKFHGHDDSFLFVFRCN